jgi:hypothetical protein
MVRADARVNPIYLFQTSFFTSSKIFNRSDLLSEANLVAHGFACLSSFIFEIFGFMYPQFAMNTRMESLLLQHEGIHIAMVSENSSIGSRLSLQRVLS